MYVIMGGTGHVGSATAATLLAAGEEVTIVTRDRRRAANLSSRGANIVEADVEDVVSLRNAFRRGRRALLLNPPADPTSDTDTAERRTVACIIEALEDSGLEKVVGASTGGAQPGTRLGDLNTLWELEEGLRHQPIPAAINRAAYYMSNWDGQLETVRSSGKLQTMYAADLKIPMVAPLDVGRTAATRLMSHLNDVGVRYVEGPERYSPRDVARAFAKVLGQAVELEVTPRDQWRSTLLSFGFSDAAAESYERMIAVTVDRGFDMPKDAKRGTTNLETHVRQLVETPSAHPL